METRTIPGPQALGHAVRAARLAFGDTQDQLAERVPEFKSQSGVSRVECGVQPLAVSELLGLVAALAAHHGTSELGAYEWFLARAVEHKACCNQPASDLRFRLPRLGRPRHTLMQLQSA